VKHERDGLEHDSITFRGHGPCARCLDTRVGLVVLAVVLAMVSICAGFASTVLNENFFGMAHALSTQLWISWMTSFVPFVFVVLCLGFPQRRSLFVEWQRQKEWTTYVLPLLVPVRWIASALPMLRFDPLAFVYVLLFSVGSVKAVEMGRKLTKSKSNWINLFVATTLFAMLDLLGVSAFVCRRQFVQFLFHVIFSSHYLCVHSARNTFQRIHVKKEKKRKKKKLIF
jgi:hypothetical protein